MELERVLRMRYDHVAGMLRDCNRDIMKIKLSEQGFLYRSTSIFIIDFGITAPQKSNKSPHTVFSIVGFDMDPVIWYIVYFE